MGLRGGPVGVKVKLNFTEGPNLQVVGELLLLEIHMQTL